MVNIQEEVYKKIEEMSDDKEPIIFENHYINKRVEIETYIVIVEIHSFGFRIYQGMLHSDGDISVKFVSIDVDMFNAMKTTFIKE